MLAFGDSITNGGGELQWGVALQSWALWVARALGLPFTTYAVDGARVGDVLAQQIPAFEQRTAHPDARYDLGCLYIGVNDVRALDWDAARFEARLRARAGVRRRSAATACSRSTAPLDLGRPRAGAKVRELNAVDRAARARARGRAGPRPAPTSAARNLVMADHVHPTAFGQIAIAERALAVLGATAWAVGARASAELR